MEGVALRKRVAQDGEPRRKGTSERGTLGQAARRVLARADRLVFPEAKSAGGHWQRVAMNEAIGAYITSLDPAGLTAAEISGDTHANRPWKSHTSLNFPEFDLCADLEEDVEFDVVICEQVLEHVVDPCAAAANLRRLSAVGGHVIVSTPFLLKIHELPIYAMHDYWRFTPRGLRTLLERAGLEVDTVSSWGNRACVVGNFERWSAYKPWHSMRNVPDLPVQVWAFATNPG
jgi:SAM-dependent methyltransferase